MRLLTNLFLIFQWQNVQGIVTFRSLEPLNKTDAFAGIRFIKESALKETNFSDGIAFCVRFNYQRLDESARIFATEKPGSSTYTWVWAGYEETFFFFGDKNWIVKVNTTGTDSDFLIWSTNTWHHACVSFNKTSSHLIFVKDGQVTNIDFVDFEISTEALNGALLDNFLFGRGAFPGSSRHAGDISDANIWDYPISRQELKDWTSCKTNRKGNIVDWSTAKWDITNMKEIDIQLSTMCNALDLGPVLIPEKMPMNSVLDLCNKINGTMFAARNQDDVHIVQSLLWKNNPPCWHIWSGWWDEPEEGVFSNVNNKSEVMPKIANIWQKSEPNGDRRENCAVFNNDKLIDYNCDKSECGICDVGPSPTFVIRGLCENSKFDFHYGWTGEFSEGEIKRFTFRGFLDSFLFWDDLNQYWKLEHQSDPNVYAVINGTKGSAYPLGTSNWFIFNDDCKDEMRQVEENVYEYEVSFSSCHDMMFNCLDGNCIDLVNRCDGVIHCKDKSDEMNCKKIKVDEAYIKDAPPPPMEHTDEKLRLNTYLEVLNVLELNEVSTLMTLQLKLTLEWIDPRLEFLDLKDDDNFNTLTPEEVDSIWMPTLVFANTKNKQEANFRNHTGFASVRINPGSKGIPNSLEKIHNGHWYKGEFCTLSVTQYFTVDFICNYEMSKYPFDYQQCKAILEPKRNSEFFVNITVQNLSYTGPKDLMKYVMEGISMVPLESYTSTYVVFEIKLGRQILSEILTTILPTVLIVLVSFSTNHYGEENFEAIVTVNLTALLVLATLFISVFNGLPRTSGIKMIDCWLLFALLMPFLEVILHARMAGLRQRIKTFETTISDGKNSVKPIWSNTSELSQERLNFLKKKEEIKLKITNKITTYGLPTLALCFLIFFFTIGTIFINI